MSDNDFLKFIKENKFNNVSEIIKFLIRKNNNITLRKLIKEKCIKIGIDSRNIQKYFKKEKFLLSDDFKKLNNFSEEFIKPLDKRIPGIYLIENNINHHKYIGQSVDLRRRLLWHLKSINWKTEGSNYPLYRAFKKYGVTAFSFRILTIFIEEDYDDLSDLKQKLDYFEIKYIKEYNTYGGNGYNQTLGGDKSVLGYKWTEEQKIKSSERAKKRSLDKIDIIWYYDLETKVYDFRKNVIILEKEININRFSLKRYGTVVRHRYITAKTKEDLERYVNKYNQRKSNRKKD